MRVATRILAVALLLLLVPALLGACPLCKDSKSDADYAGGTASLPNGFYYSILLMVSAPFAVVGGLGLRIYLARRRRRLEGGTEPEDAPSGLLPDSGGARS
jgi:hypothetical protein